MSETFVLKFPDGQFTHTELAKFNNRTNQQVWTRYQAAAKAGIIIRDGERKSAGKGKPSLLWKINPNPPAIQVVVATAPVVVAAATPAAATVIPTEPIVVPAVPTPAPAIAEPTPAVTPEPTAVETIQPAAVEQLTQPTEPIVAPTPEPAPEQALAPVVEKIEQANDLSAEAVLTVEVVRIEPPMETIPTPEVVTSITSPIPTAEELTANTVVNDARQLNETCPACNNKLFAVTDATGVMVWCAQGKEVCASAEAPAGHGKNDAAAYDALMAKWAPLLAPK